MITPAEIAERLAAMRRKLSLRGYRAWPQKVVGDDGAVTLGGKVLSLAQIVRVQSTKEGHDRETHFGILVGYMSRNIVLRVSGDKTLHVEYGADTPVIFVPDFRDVLFGFECWWTELPDGHAQINIEAKE
jgi:hypothetical protein